MAAFKLGDFPAAKAKFLKAEALAEVKVPEENRSWAKLSTKAMPAEQRFRSEAGRRLFGSSNFTLRASSAASLSSATAASSNLSSAEQELLDIKNWVMRAEEGEKETHYSLLELSSPEDSVSGTVGIGIADAFEAGE